MGRDNGRPSPQQLFKRSSIAFEYAESVCIDDYRPSPGKQDALDKVTHLGRSAQTRSDRQRVRIVIQLREGSGVRGPALHECLWKSDMNRRDVLGRDSESNQTDSAAKGSLSRQDRGARHAFAAGNDRKTTTRSLVCISWNLRNSLRHPVVIDKQRKRLERRLTVQSYIEDDNLAGNLPCDEKPTLQHAECQSEICLDAQPVLTRGRVES